MSVTRINPDYSSRLNALEAFARAIDLVGASKMSITARDTWVAFTFDYPSDTEYPYRVLVFNTNGNITYGKRKTNGVETNIFTNRA